MLALQSRLSSRGSSVDNAPVAPAAAARKGTKGANKGEGGPSGLARAQSVGQLQSCKREGVGSKGSERSSARKEGKGSKGGDGDLQQVQRDFFDAGAGAEAGSGEGPYFDKAYFSENVPEACFDDNDGDFAAPASPYPTPPSSGASQSVRGLGRSQSSTFLVRPKD